MAGDSHCLSVICSYYTATRRSPSVLPPRSWILSLPSLFPLLRRSLTDLYIHLISLSSSATMVSSLGAVVQFWFLCVVVQASPINFLSGAYSGNNTILAPRLQGQFRIENCANGRQTAIQNALVEAQQIVSGVAIRDTVFLL
jgi:hypothetical protein